MLSYTVYCIGFYFLTLCYAGLVALASDDVPVSVEIRFSQPRACCLSHVASFQRGSICPTIITITEIWSFKNLKTHNKDGPFGPNSTMEVSMDPLGSLSMIAAASYLAETETHKVLSQLRIARLG